MSVIGERLLLSLFVCCCCSVGSKKLTFVCWWVVCGADLEKAASGARGAYGHFVGNHAILRTFSVKYPVLLAKDQGRRVEDGE